MFIVANIGVNWWSQKGGTKRAEELVRAAIDSGVHGVCVPYLRADKLHKKPDIAKNLRRFDIPPETLYDLKKIAKEEGVTFWVAPDHADDVEYLETIDVDGYHIQNGNLDVIPLLKAIAKTEKPVVMSTGFASFDEINAAVEAILDVRGDDAAEAELMLLHSTGAMPTPAAESQLGRILDLAAEFMPLFVGYESFLSANNTLLDYAAMTYNPAIIMRRLDLADRKGVETEYSLTPDQLKQLVEVALQMEWVNNPQFYADEFTEGDWDARIKRRRCKESDYKLPPES